MKNAYGATRELRLEAVEILFIRDDAHCPELVVLGGACRGGRVSYGFSSFSSNCGNSRLRGTEDLLGTTRAMSYG